MSEHTPARPGWDCLACGRPWPCDPAREALATRFKGTRLAVFTAAYLGEATRDLTTTPPAELYDRFIAWTRRAR